MGRHLGGGRPSPGETLSLQFVDTLPLSPKRPLVERAGGADIFPYYAGFSFEFAVAELEDAARDEGDVLVFDPWNGGGTTTRAAQHLGLRSIGVDLNPAANVAASLRCHQNASFLDVGASPEQTTERTEGAFHPLLHWFCDQTLLRILSWTHRFNQMASESQASAQAGTLAIFRSVRSFTKPFQGSNPTWVRRAKHPEERITIDSATLDDKIASEYQWIVSRMTTEAAGRDSLATVVTASANQLPMRDDKVSTILTSPPYLTRIDYAVAYARELAVLGVDVWGQNRLRRSLMGTTLTRSSRSEINEVGVVAEALLHDVKSHESKASSNYYSNQAAQYVDDLCQGLGEITRVSREGAKLTLVVQDSYYKDVHVPLADMCVDEARRRGWTVEFVRPFRVKRSLVDLNRSARAYSKGAVAESVIRLRLREKLTRH